MTSLLLILAALGLQIGSRELVRARRRGRPLTLGAVRRLRRRDEVDVVALLGALRAELLAGRPPGPALMAVIDEHDRDGRLAGVAAALRLGGDPAAALRSGAGSSTALAGLSALWSVSESTGATLASAVGRLADGERARLATRRELRTELAAARATGQVLALLPFAGIVLGSMLGADPVGWLLGSPIGWADLALTAGLVALGLRWLRGILRRVEERA